MHQVSTDDSFRLVVLGLLSADEQVSQLSPELESGWSALVGSNWKLSNWFHDSSCQKLKKEAWVRFKINEMLFYCLDDLKVYEVICYTIIKVGCVTKKLSGFSCKAVLVSP